MAVLPIPGFPTKTADFSGVSSTITSSFNSLSRAIAGLTIYLTSVKFSPIFSNILSFMLFSPYKYHYYYNKT